jgi:hypothetical protein
MMGITVPETCWAASVRLSNKFYDWLLHLLGVLFEHFFYLLVASESVWNCWLNRYACTRIQANRHIDRPHITAECIPSGVIKHAVSGKFLLLRNRKVRLCPLKSGQLYHNCSPANIKYKRHFFRSVNFNDAWRENWKLQFGWPLKCKCACTLF